MSFDAFPAATLTFLRKLAKNNERDWFVANKKEYEAAYKQPAKEFAEALEDGLKKLTRKPYKSKVFRVNRDLRFSKDKTPYNAHIRIGVSPEKAGLVAPAFMFSLEPKLLCAGVGVFDFGKQMDAYRKKVAGKSGDKLQEIIDEVVGSGGRMHGEPELKRVPSGFDAEHKHADLLRRKSVAVFHDFKSVKEATQPGFTDACLEQFKTMKPLFDWLSKVA